MPVAKHSYDNAISQLKELKEKDSDLTSIFDCYENILKAQKETGKSFDPDLHGLDFTACIQKHADGLPFLNSDTISITWDLFDKLAKKTCEITKLLAKSGESEVEKFLMMLSDNSEMLHDILLKGVLEDSTPLKELAEKTGIGYDTIIFISIQSLTPFIEKYAEKLREYIDSNVWLKGSCPVCGGEPLMGRLEEETGKRHLQCYLCRTNWEFARLECPFCDNNDQKKLHYFFDEEHKHRRVELCDQCKGYLKVIDIREVGDRFSLVVENLATLPLDVVAKREGFTRDTNRLFGL
jgi:FdhE protein